MKRREFIRNTSFLMPAAWSPDALIKKFFADPWKIQMLTRDTGIFTERGGTILFHISKLGMVVVDSQFPEQAGHLISELKKKSDQPFELLINTHHHGDHSGGNIAFKELVRRVLAHKNSKTNQMRVAKERNLEAGQLYPSQTFENVWSEKIGRERITLHYFGPGHTDGDSLIHLEKSKIVHMGDLMFNRRHPNVDRTAGASVQNWVRVLDQAIRTFHPKTTYVFGHAAETYPVTGTRQDLEAFKSYLGALLDFTADARAKGISKEDFLKTKEIPGAGEWKGDGIARPLGAAWDELASGSQTP
jgi:glyoxylase-like metal-dependent hydrolase (beta-lactamase superfamily II)